MLRVVFLLLFMFHGFSFQNVNETCVTPNNESGVCVNYNDCPFIYKILAQETTTDEETKLLQAHLCEGDSIEVFCCPLFPEPGFECGFIMGENKIVQGKQSKIDDHPWTALLLYKKNDTIDYTKRCGGTLINNRYVITAAHCVHNDNDGFSLFQVRLGEYDIKSVIDCDLLERICADPVLDVDIEETIIHSRYINIAKNKANDIALIRLNYTIAYTNFIKPLCLPGFDFNNFLFYSRSTLEVVGWGVTEQNETSSVKMVGRINGFLFPNCEEIMASFNITLIRSHICAYHTKIDSCSGDSGGPLIGYDSKSTKNPFRFLIGIVSFGSSYCDGQYPGIYINVYSFMDWIKNQIRF